MAPVAEVKLVAGIAIVGNLRRSLLKAAAVLCAGFACSVQFACSPYVFSDNVQTFSTEMRAIDSSYQDSAQKIVAEQHLSNRIEWMRDKPALALGPGCTTNVYAIGTARCDLLRKTAETTGMAAIDPVVEPPQPTPPAVPTRPAVPTPPAVDVCEPVAGVAPSPKAEAVEALPPLQPAQLLKTLDNYIAALAAVTKAQDRAEFDNAAAKVSAAVGGLAQSAPPPLLRGCPGSKASSNLALWLVGQDLDYRRLQELQSATRAACEPIHVLTKALGVVLEGQRRIRLRGLHGLLALKIEAVNIARTTPHVTGETYGAAMDDAQAVADAFQTVRATDPQATAQALSDAHDALVVAVRNNDGQFAALITSLQAFAHQADDLATAAAATANSPVKKS
jgi:hypothetical protein